MIFCWNYCVDVVLILDLWLCVMIFCWNVWKFLLLDFCCCCSVFGFVVICYDFYYGFIGLMLF